MPGGLNTIYETTPHILYHPTDQMTCISSLDNEYIMYSTGRVSSLATVARIPYDNGIATILGYNWCGCALSADWNQIIWAASTGLILQVLLNCSKLTHCYRSILSSFTIV